MRKNALLKNLLLGLLIPCGTLLVVEVIALIRGVRLFANADSWKLFFRAVANVTLTTFALSINLDSGRFDFSLGAVSMLSADRKTDGAGYCGKGHKEWVKTAQGGPYLKTKARLG